MKEIIKTIGATIAVGAAMVLFVGMAVEAFDNQWESRAREEFDLRYEHRFEEEEFDLLNPTYLTTLQAQMPSGFKFADWGYPEFDNEEVE